MDSVDMFPRPVMEFYTLFREHGEHVISRLAEELKPLAVGAAAGEWPWPPAVVATTALAGAISFLLFFLWRMAAAAATAKRKRKDAAADEAARLRDRIDTLAREKDEAASTVSELRMRVEELTEEKQKLSEEAKKKKDDGGGWRLELEEEDGKVLEAGAGRTGFLGGGEEKEDGLDATGETCRRLPQQRLSRRELEVLHRQELEQQEALLTEARGKAAEAEDEVRALRQRVGDTEQRAKRAEELHREEMREQEAAFETFKKDSNWQNTLNQERLKTSKMRELLAVLSSQLNEQHAPPPPPHLLRNVSGPPQPPGDWYSGPPPSGWGGGAPSEQPERRRIGAYGPQPPSDPQGHHYYPDNRRVPGIDAATRTSPPANMDGGSSGGSGSSSRPQDRPDAPEAHHDPPRLGRGGVQPPPPGPHRSVHFDQGPPLIAPPNQGALHLRPPYYHHHPPSAGGSQGHLHGPAHPGSTVGGEFAPRPSNDHNAVRPRPPGPDPRGAPPPRPHTPFAPHDARFPPPPPPHLRQPPPHDFAPMSPPPPPPSVVQGGHMGRCPAPFPPDVHVPGPPQHGHGYTPVPAHLPPGGTTQPLVHRGGRAFPAHEVAQNAVGPPPSATHGGQRHNLLAPKPNGDGAPPAGPTHLPPPRKITGSTPFHHSGAFSQAPPPGQGPHTVTGQGQGFATGPQGSVMPV